MKPSPALLLAALLPMAPGCSGGNWSNRALEFLNALPERRDLESHVPESGSTQGGLNTRRDGLTVGERSGLYDETRKGSKAFNDGTFNILVLLEAVRTFPPTRREGARLTWGPAAVKEFPGLEARIVMDQLSELEFRYTVDWRKAGSGEWVTVIDGAATASERVRKGTGTMVYDAKRLRDAQLPTDPKFPTLERIVIDYDTAADPVAVDLVWFDAAGTLKYRSRERPDGSGRLSFIWKGNLVPGAALEVLTVTSDWLPDGRDKAVALVQEGDGAGHNHTECWDSGFLLTYGSKSWETSGPVGSPASCPPELSGL